jgi:hypothetical protein
MNKHEMIQQAYRWRESLRKQSNEELYNQIYYVFFLILLFNHTSYLYKNYNFNYHVLDLD